ncbi:MAG: hypothetical protein AB7D36_05525 [Oscillospiraceae bacterium]
MSREIEIIRESPFARVEFNSNGQRVQRNITIKELAALKDNLSSPEWVEQFCYSIV